MTCERQAHGKMREHRKLLREPRLYMDSCEKRELSREAQVVQQLRLGGKYPGEKKESLD